MRRSMGTGIAALLLVAACVHRDNPWDPVNYRLSPASIDCDDPAVAGPLRDSLDTLVRVLFADAAARAWLIDTALDRWARDSAVNAALSPERDSLSSVNTTRVRLNTTVRASNAAAVTADALQFMVLLDTLPHQTPVDTAPALASLTASLTIGRLRADSAIARTNARCAQGVIVAEPLAAAWLGPFDSLAALCESTARTLGRNAQAAADTNLLSVIPANVWIRAYNDSVRTYNDSIRFVRQVFARGQITSTTVLEQLVYASTPGDTFVVAAGVYGPVIRFANNGTPDSPIVILGQPSLTTVFAGADVILSGTRHVTFASIVFRRNRASGVKLEAGATGVVFERCIFDSNAAHGLEVVDSDVRLLDCRVMRNGACGLRASSGATPATVTAINTLFAANARQGIEALSTVLHLQYVTIDNNSDGVLLNDPERELYLLSSLVTGNRRDGIRYESGGGALAPVLSATVLWGNARAQVAGTFDPAVSYLTVQTAYVDTAAGNYDIAPGCGLDSLQRAVPGLVIGYRRR